MLRVVQHPDQKGHQLILNSLSGEVQVFGFVVDLLVEVGKNRKQLKLVAKKLFPCW